jgi:putative acetyltransferase
MPTITIKTGDLRGAQTIALLEAQRQNMFENSPPECVFVLDLEGLCQPEITFWSAWEGDEIQGCGALEEISSTQAELKSMRTDAVRLRTT